MNIKQSLYLLQVKPLLNNKELLAEVIQVKNKSRRKLLPKEVLQVKNKELTKAPAYGSTLSKSFVEKQRVDEGS